MSTSSRDAGAWTLDGATGALGGKTFSAQVDLARPQFGVQRLCVGGRPVVGQFLGLTPGIEREWPAKLSEAYVRGMDLVASYKSVDDWPYSPQVYWSADRDSSKLLGALSLLVSIQTSLLDTHPHVDVVTALRAEAMLHINSTGGDEGHLELLPEGEHVFEPPTAASCVLWRLADMPISYAEIVPASDFHRLTVRSLAGGACEARWQLFAEFLEKGVIRRARVHTAFLPREGDGELAAELCRASENWPLPLTT